MAFQPVNSEINFVGSYVKKGTKDPAFEKGDVLAEGTFIGPYNNQFNEDRPHVMLKDKEGVRQVVNSAGHLHYLFFGDDSEIIKGDYVRITYDGLKTLTTGRMAGKDSHTFLVDKDDELYEPVRENIKLVEESTAAQETLSNFDPSKQ